MKTLITSTITTIAALTIFNACTHSDSATKSNAISSPESTKVETQNMTTLVGTYKGLSAVCEDGTEAKQDNESIQVTTLTLTNDGFFRSERQIKDSALEVEGTYTVADDKLTLTTKSESFEGQIGFTDVSSESKFKLEDKELTLTVLPTEDSPCPTGKTLIIKYQRQETSPTTSSPTPTPTPAA